MIKIIALVVVLVVALAIIWSQMTRSSASDDVRRFDMGAFDVAAQQAQAELEQDGIQTRVVSLESGAVGLGLGLKHYLVYNAEDEVAVSETVGRIMREFE